MHGLLLRAFARRVAVAESALTPVTQLLASFAVAAVINFAIYQSRTDKTTVGGFVSFITAMLMLLAPLKRVSNISSNLQKGLASAEVVFDLLDAPAEHETNHAMLGNDFCGQIEFRNVSLRYDQAERDSLNNVQLVVEPGEVVALVGPSVGGKTSLANLLLRFYEPSQGGVYIDGQAIPELTRASIRSKIAVVSQETILFNVWQNYYRYCASLVHHPKLESYRCNGSRNNYRSWHSCSIDDARRGVCSFKCR